MKDIKLSDSELKVMDVIWRQGEASAKDIAREIKDKIGWEKNTTYTVIKKLIDKGAIERGFPEFICKPLISRKQTQKLETNTLLDKMCGGSLSLFFSTFLKEEKLSEREIEELKKIIENKGDK